MPRRLTGLARRRLRGTHGAVLATSAPWPVTSSDGEQGCETRAQGTEQLGSVSLQVPCSDVFHMPSLFLSWGSNSPRQTQSIGEERPDCLFEVRKEVGTQMSHVELHWAGGDQETGPSISLSPCCSQPLK